MRRLIPLLTFLLLTGYAFGEHFGSRHHLPAPTNLTATAGDRTVTLTWTASQGAEWYRVKRSMRSDGRFWHIAITRKTTFTDAHLINGRTYFYKVSALGHERHSANSAVVSATPTSGSVTVPAAPAGLTATAGNGQVTLSWSASSGATSYGVKRSTSSGGPYSQISAPTATNFTDSGLTNGTTYFYVVSATNASGESANSPQASATPKPPVPAIPVGLAATGGNQQVSLSWTASSGAASYNVKRSTSSSGPFAMVGSPNGNSFTNSGLADSTTYFFVVSAVNGSGESANSTAVSATTATPLPAAPTGVSATAGNQQIIVSWSAVSGAMGYKVSRATTSGGPYTAVATPVVTSFTDSNVTDGTTYFYVVSAINSAGEGANSTQVSAAPLPPAPVAPTGLSANAGDQQVALSWNASTGATSYNVKRSTTTGGPYSLVTTLSVTNFTDTGLTDGMTYFYVVSASNSSGESTNSAQVSASPANVQADVTVTVDPTKTHAISPWIYGINSFSSIPNAPHFTMDRMGGNRWTAYNWETNASNAGSDFNYQNDDFLSSSSIAGEAVRPVIEADQNSGMASLMTVQLQGLVAGDESGPVSVANPPDLTRFKRIGFKKSLIVGDPFTLTPPTTDSIVYMDEFVWAMDQKFPGMGIFGANAQHPTFISLDNEPELWNSTHLELQDSTPVDSSAYITKTINLTKAIKDQFPNAMIFGPVHYGFQGIYNWQGEFTATPTGADWFPDRYLPALKSASNSYGRPLVDVYDFHWYAEDYDSNGTRVTDLSGTNLTDAQVQLIVQSPRNLWDSTFTDSGNSNRWINSELGNAPINILGRLQSKINAEFPGMKMAITEYESGGWNHIAGTIAQADNLGIFGSQGLFAASFWPPNGTYDYALAGFRAFRGFDGSNANFGDTSVQATSSNVQNVVVYASTDSTTPGRVVFVAINRSASPQVTAINGQTLSGTASMYQITAASAQGQNPVAPVAIGQMPVSGSSLTLTLPAYSVTTIDVQ